MASLLKTPRSEISDAEWHVRRDLAACYRLFVKFGWTDSIFTHLSARVPDRPDHYLINPFGLLFAEIHASNLIKVDFEGKVVAGDSPYNDAGHAIHSSILKSRPDVNAVLHSHTRAGIAVSCMQRGLIPLSQQAGEIVDLVAYHDYGYAAGDNADECLRLGSDMADKWLMIMHNHGLLAAGRSVAEAFYYLYTLENACKVQVDVMASGAAIKTADPAVLAELGRFSAPPAGGPAEHVVRLWQAECRWLEHNDPDYLE